VLFLDEPTNGVDPVSRRDFWRILYQLLKEKVTIFVSTAYLDEAERCNRVGLLHKGKLLALGTPGELKTLMRGTIVEIRATEPRRAAALLQGRFPSGSVGLFGSRVHVVTDDPDRIIAQSEETLGGNGIKLAGTRAVEPSLEDVFISVVGATEEKGATHE